MSLAKDPYAILGVSRSASDAEIRSAHRRLVKELHPDLHPGDPGKASRFKSVSAAFEILSDATQRAKYDKGEIDGDGNPTHPFAGQYGSAGPGSGGAHGDPFEDILSGLFGGGRSRRRTGPVKGRDVRYQVDVSFEDAVTGARRRMAMADGRSLEVDIPAGIEDGQTLRLKSQGHSAPSGGAPGDALLQVRVMPSRVWTREGINLHMVHAIPLRAAVLGAKVQVPTPSGAVSLNVPPGSNTGTTLRLKGKGVRSAKGIGNLFVKLELVLDDPKDPDLIAFLKAQSD